jgi:hypothetical protein
MTGAKSRLKPERITIRWLKLLIGTHAGDGRKPKLAKRAIGSVGI